MKTKITLYLILVIVIGISCKSKPAKPADPRPIDQLEYLQTILKYQIDYKNSVGNEISQEENTNSAKNFLNEKRTANNWVGRVLIVGRNTNPLNDYYEKAYVNLSLFPWDLSYAVKEKIPYDGANVILTIYNIDDQTASSLRMGQIVTFSCNIVEEKSVTNKGALEQPEVIAEAIGSIQVKQQ